MNKLAEKACINWGIIGCGDVTEVKSGPAFNKVAHSRLLGVMRRDHEKAKDYAARHGVPKVYVNAEALIQDPEIDAVYIATPPDTHCDYALQVAQAAKPCCVEKPMALNYTQCAAMNAAFDKAGQPLFVAYYRRFLPRFLQVKHWLDTGLIGEVLHVDWRYLSPATDRDIAADNWRVQPAIAGGGYFVDLASHGIDLLQFLVGAIDRVNGIARHQKQRYPAEDAVVASFGFRNGATGTGTWNFNTHSFSDEVMIVGEQGSIRFSVFAEADVSIDARERKESLHIPHPEHVQLNHIDHMVQHLRGECRHSSLGDTAAMSTRIMEQILAG
ncbi:MAG: Gfo/Idh/MocA family oxidoreductase [Cellvibrionaceae bacterium]|nr:Gfo/Idh/MocA family oxidoreductase [Cellvibrionaceae bacterium]